MHCTKRANGLSILPDEYLVVFDKFEFWLREVAKLNNGSRRKPERVKVLLRELH